MNTVVRIGAGLSVAIMAAGLALPAAAGETNQVVVLGVHNEQATAPVAKALGLDSSKTAGGRFAVVQLRKGYGNGSYALVYVPRDIAVQKNDIVELTPSDLDLWSNPGKGAVTKLHAQLADNR